MGTGFDSAIAKIRLKIKALLIYFQQLFAYDNSNIERVYFLS